jgi:hypothetical protein
VTPLYQNLIRQILDPSRRTGVWRDPKNTERLKDYLTGAHCFEVSAIDSLMRELSEKIHSGGLRAVKDIFTPLGFLPAPKTWIELRTADGPRVGFYLARAEGHGIVIDCLTESTAVRLACLQDHWRGDPSLGIAQTRYAVTQ